MEARRMFPVVTTLAASPGKPRKVQLAVLLTQSGRHWAMIAKDLIIAKDFRSYGANFLRRAKSLRDHGARRVTRMLSIVSRVPGAPSASKCILRVEASKVAKTAVQRWKANSEPAVVRVSDPVTAQKDLKIFEERGPLCTRGCT
jgi:hypothetical protein